MRVFSLTTGADTAGIGAGLAHAFRRSRDIELRSMVATINYIGYPVDVRYSRRRLERYYDSAAVILLHNTLHGHDWYDAGQGKPTVLMHHGRTPIEPFLETVKHARDIGAVQIGSTLDLSVFGPVEWAPPPVDIREMRAIRARATRSRTLRIGHAPTNRDLKGTSAFLDAMDRLSTRFDVEAVLIERTSWRDCLARKATMDVLFDQPILGYGSNAIEAWAMGIPVLAGVADQTVRAAMLERWTVLPFIETSTRTLEQDLERVIVEAELREEYAVIGSAHVERWHSEAAVVDRVSDVFRRATPTVPGGSGKRRNPPRVLTSGMYAHKVALAE
jgi:hypothetical protein